MRRSHTTPHVHLHHTRRGEVKCCTHTHTHAHPRAHRYPLVIEGGEGHERRERFRFNTASTFFLIDVW